MGTHLALVLVLHVLRRLSLVRVVSTACPRTHPPSIVSEGREGRGKEGTDKKSTVCPGRGVSEACEAEGKGREEGRATWVDRRARGRGEWGTREEREEEEDEERRTHTWSLRCACL